MNRRKFLMSGGAVGLGLPLIFSAQTSAKTKAAVYEYTFLKSTVDKPDDLIRFIVANWFAMDKIAVKKGLMSNYAVFESPAEDGSSNVVVAVGYPNEKGYEAIADKFEEIRKKHQKVLIGGKDLKELGKIVGSRKFYPRGGSDE